MRRFHSTVKFRKTVQIPKGQKKTQKIKNPKIPEKNSFPIPALAGKPPPRNTPKSPLVEIRTRESGAFSICRCMRLKSIKRLWCLFNDRRFILGTDSFPFASPQNPNPWTESPHADLRPGFPGPHSHERRLVGVHMVVQFNGLQVWISRHPTHSLWAWHRSKGRGVV